MHVQPNARVDIATGLPIPVIAVGTDDHLCILKMMEPLLIMMDLIQQVVKFVVVVFLELLFNKYNYIYKTDLKMVDSTYLVSSIIIISK